MFSFSFNIFNSNVSEGTPVPPPVILSVPQDIALVEDVIKEMLVTWTDVPETVDGYRIYRRLTSVGGSWGSPIGTVGEGVQAFTDTTIASMTEYDYKVNAYLGAVETIPANFGENYGLITSLEIIPGICFEYDNLEFLLKDVQQDLVAPWGVKLGIQDVSFGSGSLVGLFGRNVSTTWRVYASSNAIAQSRSGLPNKNSGDIGSLDFISRGVQEWYCEAGGDVYYKPTPTATPIFLWNQEDPPVVTMPLTAIFRAGNTINAEGYLYYMEITDNGVTEVYDINEGSGATVTGDLGSTWTIQTTEDLTHINNVMWQPTLPAPAGFVPFTSLSSGGRPTASIDIVLSADPSSYTIGSIDYQIASIYNIGNHNPDGWTHALITPGTNDIANPDAFATPDEYETALTAVVQKLKTAGVTPIICICGSMVTSVKQAQKDYDDTIGAMLSGDPMNPTPESGWDFNESSAGVVAVTPLYVAKAVAVAAAESVTFIDTFQHFIDGQVAPFDQWIGADGIHYNPTGYTEYGIAVANVLDTLGFVGTEKICVIGDSLGNGIAESIQSQYNS